MQLFGTVKKETTYHSVNMEDRSYSDTVRYEFSLTSFGWMLVFFALAILLS